MLTLALTFAAGALAAAAIRATLDVLRSLPRSNGDWVWY